MRVPLFKQAFDEEGGVDLVLTAVFFTVGAGRAPGAAAVPLQFTMAEPQARRKRAAETYWTRAGALEENMHPFEGLLNSEGNLPLDILN